jgi:serine/threonine protein phosphatase PrpC
MRIEVGPSRPLAPRDSVIVGSDGLFDNLHLEEVVQIAKSGKLIDRVSRLADQATVRMSGNETDVPGKPDDLTILIYSR